MLLVRDVMYCKPGKARPMVEKFLALANLGKTMGFTMRVMTDVCAERYWTVVAEMEVSSLADYEKTLQSTMGDTRFQQAMKDYHELVEHGRREIYAIEG